MTLFFRSFCLKVSSVVAFLLIFQVAGAQLDTASLSGLMEQKVRQLKNNNVVLAMASKDTLVYKNDIKTFNVARGQGGAGYISQLFTTAVVLMLAEEGKFGLDDKIVQYLPEYARYGKNYITIRHCLTNFTGIQVPSKMAFFEKSRHGSLEEEANSYAAKEIQTNPGTESRWSERGFAIAARICEVVTKKKFEMLASQRLFRALGMRSTSFNTLDGSLANPNYGARTSAADLVLFGRMLLNGGKLNGATVLSEASVKELRRISAVSADIKGAPKDLAAYDYAMGAWALESNGGTAGSLAAPSFGGTVLVVDFCRGYTFAYLMKELEEEKKGNMMADIKATLDGGRELHCK
ncbi:MAG: class C beta-lactamase-related serine hydrolase [Chitinophagaceae bacterium]|nr:MAG: class C beta-lactamase-related serine hydrolase [Chitinophagaceae bacterium]